MTSFIKNTFTIRYLKVGDIHKGRPANPLPSEGGEGLQNPENSRRDGGGGYRRSTVLEIKINKR